MFVTFYYFVGPFFKGTFFKTSFFRTRGARCLQANLLAGGLPGGALPGLALAASIASHTRATQKSTTHARHTLWRYTRDITATIEMGGRSRIAPHPPSRRLLSYLLPCIPIHLFLCGVRVLCSFVWRACVVLFCQLQAPDRAAHLQASPQPRD